MIREVHVKNYLYIKDERIRFDPHLNIITGESGAGKSLMVNILTLPFVAKPGRDLVGPWGNTASININIDIDQEAGSTSTDKGGHAVSSVNLEFVLRHRLSVNINGQTSSIKEARQLIGSHLDVHSQNEYEWLYRDQLSIIDKFMSSEERLSLSSYQETFDQLKMIERQIEDISKRIFSEVNRELYEYHLTELNRLNLKAGEDEDLFDMLKAANQLMKSRDSFFRVKELIEEAASNMHRALNTDTDQLKDIDLAIGMSEKINSIEADIEDLVWSLVKFEERFDGIGAEELEQIEQRLSDIENIKKKFKRSSAELVQYRQELERDLSMQDAYKIDVRTLMEQKEELEHVLYKKADVLMETRMKVSHRLILQMKEQLNQLKLNQVEFKAEFSRGAASDQGMDNFRFLIRANTGGNFTTLDRLSGGETSRLILGIKAVLVNVSSYHTFILDEIDSGVSGDVAEAMSRLIQTMSRSRQLIVITHLPALAVKGSSLFRLYKQVEKDQTMIHIEKLSSKTDIIDHLSTLITDHPSKESKAYVKSLLLGA